MTAHDHPVWCSPEHCTLTPDSPDGWHESVPVDIDSAAGHEPVSNRLFLSRSESGNGQTVLMMEMRYDKGCEAAEMPDEPDAYPFSLDQAHRIRSGMDRLLNLTTARRFTP